MHPHIAPDLRDGLCAQSKFSDVYSFGRVLRILFKKVPFSSIPTLGTIAHECIKYNCIDQPTTNDVYISLTNLMV